MEVRLEKTWPLEVSRAQAWAVLSDVRAVAACMPGAQLTEQVDETHFKGVVRSKVGPAVMVFSGDIEVLGVDPVALQLALAGKGADKSGSAAAMKLVARIDPGGEPANCILSGDATVTVSGKLAQFGGRLLVPVADAMLAQFAESFLSAAAAVPPPADAAVEAAAEPVDAIEAATARAPAAAGGNVPPKELNVLALAWTIVRGWLRHLFGNKTA
jgi:carbon monoxide dehydrogenase subunit G